MDELVREIEFLEECKTSLVSKAKFLDSTLLDDEANSINNLKIELDKAIEELGEGILDLKKKLQTMKNNKIW